MDLKRIFSIIIFVIFVSGFLVGALAFINKKEDENIIKNFKLKESEFPGVKYVNITIESNTSGVKLSFENSTNEICNFNVGHNIKTNPVFNYTIYGDTLNVKLKLNKGSTSVFLSNKYIYNITINDKVGGVEITLGNNSKIDMLNVNINYFGGGKLKIQDVVFKNIKLNVNTGGFNILNTGHLYNGSINTNVTIGGVSMLLNSLSPIRIISDVDSGGISFNANTKNAVILENTTNHLELETKSYTLSKNGVEVVNKVGLGGINIDMI